jgi:hypothetical protein
MQSLSAIDSSEMMMDPEVKSELHGMLAAYAALVVESHEREAKTKAAQTAFVDAFRQLKVEKIRPILDEFVVDLLQGGHQATVVDQQEASDRNGQFTPSSIALRVVPARMAGATAASSTLARVEVTFSGNSQTRKVLVSSSNNANGSIGRRGDYELEDVTPEFVQNNVLNTIRAAFTSGK